MCVTTEHVAGGASIRIRGVRIIAITRPALWPTYGKPGRNSYRPPSLAPRLAQCGVHSLDAAPLQSHGERDQTQRFIRAVHRHRTTHSYNVSLLNGRRHRNRRQCPRDYRRASWQEDATLRDESVHCQPRSVRLSDPGRRSAWHRAVRSESRVVARSRALSVEQIHPCVLAVRIRAQSRRSLHWKVRTNIRSNTTIFQVVESHCCGITIMMQNAAVL